MTQSEVGLTHSGKRELDPDSKILAIFKSNQGLSHRNIADIFGVSPNEARHWEVHGAPAQVNAAAFALNVIMERWKGERGSFNDVDYQHLLHNAEKLQKENMGLRGEIALLKAELSFRRDIRDSENAGRSLVHDQDPNFDPFGISHGRRGIPHE